MPTNLFTLPIKTYILNNEEQKVGQALVYIDYVELKDKDGTAKGRLGFVNIKGGFKLFIVNNRMRNDTEYNKKGIVIINKNFEDLSDLKEKFILSFCCLNSKIAYSEFCLPIKIFDSLNWGIPIAATNCKEISQIIKNKNIGFIINNDIRSFIKNFFNIINNQTHIENLHNNVCNFHRGNNWSDRVDKILKLIK